jgi:hypothetical protein
VTEGVEAVFQYIQAFGSLGLLALATKFYVDRRHLQIQLKLGDRKADLDLEVHRDGLTFELLEAARKEIASLRVEVERSRINEDHIRHFDEALQHIEGLLLAENAGERKAAERGARAFLNRMRRMQEARGIIANELQRLKSEQNLDDRAEGQP